VLQEPIDIDQYRRMIGMTAHLLRGMGFESRQRSSRSTVSRRGPSRLAGSGHPGGPARTTPATTGPVCISERKQPAKPDIGRHGRMSADVGPGRHYARFRPGCRDAHARTRTAVKRVVTCLFAQRSADDLLGTAGTTVVYRLCDALDAARCDLCDAPDAAPCDLCAAADAAPSPPSAPQHLTPSAPWLALRSPTRPLALEGKHRSTRHHFRCNFFSHVQPPFLFRHSWQPVPSVDLNQEIENSH